MNVDPKTFPTIMCNKSQPKTTRTGPEKDLKSDLIIGEPELQANKRFYEPQNKCEILLKKNEEHH